MEAITRARATPLTIGQLSKATGVNIETIRYYERIGLLPAPPRTSNGYRSYDDADVRRLQLVRRARKLGFGIEDIRALLALAEQDGASCSEVRVIAAAHLVDVQERLADLEKLEQVLSATVAACDARCCVSPAPVCPVLDVLEL